MDKKEFKKKAKNKFEEVKAEVKYRCCRVRDAVVNNGARFVVWVGEHPMETAAIATAVTAGASEVRKGLTKMANDRADRKEEQRKSTKIWDPSTGKWYTIRRPMTSSEEIEYSMRVNSGELRVMVLIDMGLL